MTVFDLRARRRPNGTTMDSAHLTSNQSFQKFLISKLGNTRALPTADRVAARCPVLGNFNYVTHHWEMTTLRHWLQVTTEVTF